MINLKQIINELNINSDVIYEVGVWMPQESHIKDLIPQAKRVVMFEAQEKYAEQSRIAFKEYDHVTVHTVAIYNENLPSIKLIDIGSSSFIDGIHSPGVNVPQYNIPQRDVFYVEAKTFDNYDDGDIDILACDTEGAEWFILEKMKSRPKLICIETHYKPTNYVNPYMKEIGDWMINNGYEKYTNDASDTIYIKK